jgi:hypothetical protein
MSEGDDLTRLTPRDGQSWEDFAAERQEQLDAYVRSLPQNPDGSFKLMYVADYWYDWDNPEDRPVMRVMEKRQGYIGSVERPIPHTGEPPSTFEHKLFTCDECGAVVVELTQEKHAVWHQNIREMLGRTGPLVWG